MPITRLENGAAQKMLSDLNKKYPTFRDFYTENRGEIDAIRINWIINANSKVVGISSPITDSITLKNYPKSKRNARIVAHEIEHLLLWKEGYPYLMADPHTEAPLRRKLESMARVLQEIIFEPMVESRLKKYFEGLCTEHQKYAMSGFKKTIENKDKILVEIEDSRALLYYSCLYVKRRLLIESTCDNDEAAEYIGKYEDNFGENIIPCAEKMMARIKKSDLSPESVKIILEKIIQNENFGFCYRKEEEFNRLVLVQ